MQRRSIMTINILLLLGMTACMSAAMLVNFAAGINDSGSVELASEWRAALAPAYPFDGPSGN